MAASVEELDLRDDEEEEEEEEEDFDEDDYDEDEDLREGFAADDDLDDGIEADDNDDGGVAIGDGAVAKQRVVERQKQIEADEIQAQDEAEALAARRAEREQQRKAEAPLVVTVARLPARPGSASLEVGDASADNGTDASASTGPSSCPPLSRDAQAHCFARLLAKSAEFLDESLQMGMEADEQDFMEDPDRRAILRAAEEAGEEYDDEEYGKEDVLGLPKCHRGTPLVLVAGKNGTGKTSLINSLLFEKALRPGATPTVIVTRETAGAIESPDFPGVVDDDDDFRKKKERLAPAVSFVDLGRVLCGTVTNTKVLDEAVEMMKTRPVHAFLYVDRMDVYRTDAGDDELIESITRHMSRDIWDRCIIVLTHAQMTPPNAAVDGSRRQEDWKAFAEHRANMIRSIIGRHSRNKKRASQIPFVCCENKAGCRIDPDSGCKMLADGTLWVNELYKAIGDVSSGVGPISPLDVEKIQMHADVDRPLSALQLLGMSAVHIAASAFLLNRIETDQVRGDMYETFPPEIQEEKLAALKAGKPVEQAGLPFRFRAGDGPMSYTREFHSQSNPSERDEMRAIYRIFKMPAKTPVPPMMAWRRKQQKIDDADLERRKALDEKKREEERKREEELERLRQEEEDMEDDDDDDDDEDDD